MKTHNKMKLLIIIDMQNDFIDGVLGTKEAQAIVPNIINKIKEYEGTNTNIIINKDTNKENYLDTQEGKNLPIPHCIYMTDGWCINKEISSYARIAEIYTYEDAIIKDSRILKSTFGSLSLMSLIKESKESIEEIIFVGVCTDICVISNAIIAKMAAPDILITVDSKCCAGTTPENHENALKAMKMCQINII
jgi:nicotinamidase-related amidase